MTLLQISHNFQRLTLSLFIIGTIITCLLTNPAQAQSPSQRPHNILILNSYHYGYLWSDGEQNGILETLRATLPESQVHTEYLDTKNFPNPEHYQYLNETLAHKYKGMPFSLILALDNPALDFLARFGTPLFGDTPIVFCGVSNFSPPLLTGLKNITGIVQRYDVRSTLKTMLHLHPATKNIFFVVDSTLTGRELRRYTEAALTDLKEEIGVTFSENSSIEAVLTQARTLPPSSLVLILTFARDKNGKIFDMPELARLVSDNANAPVYVLQEEYLGTGAVGGYLLGGKAHGVQATRLALRILGGEPAASIPIVTEPRAQPMFDFRVLKKFALEQSALPQGSIVLNQPASLYKSYRDTVWAVVLFVGFLLCTIAALLNNIRRRKLAEQEQQSLEIQLRQAQKMEAIGTLAGGIAHDFNNVLSIIFGYTQLAMLENDDPIKRREELKQVLTGAGRAKELVQQILAFSRKTDQQKLPLQLSLIIKEALKMLRSSIPTTIAIRQNINSTGTVLANPTQIHQVIMNLCTNAAHAMQESGGIMTVSLDEMELGPGEYGFADMGAGRYLRLEVSDTGSGIDPKIMDKIFEPYFTTKPQGIGTGMGLAVSHGIVKNHNGHITVYSEAGKGTSVHVYLPMVEAEAEPLPNQTTLENLKGNGERILFVDDEEQICAYISTTLENNGYRVALFPNGVEAWREFAKQPDGFDLVITDMTMPQMTGAEFAQKVLSLRPQIPVILCTGHSTLIDRSKALSLGMCDYLVKPVTTQELLGAIRTNLARNK